MITTTILANKIRDHLYSKISLEQLVDWAEGAMMEGEFEEKNFDKIKYIIATLGVADVKSFGLTPEDYQNLLHELGYRLKYIVQRIPRT